MDNNSVKAILSRYKTVAIVGLSKDPSKDSHRVAEYLKNHGFHIIPVNPTTDSTLSEKSYGSLLDIPTAIQKTLQIVDIFRPSAEALPIIEQIVQMKREHNVPYVVWMQLGIINEQAAKVAKEAGLMVIMNKCMMQQHRQFFAKNDNKRKNQ